MVLIIKKIMGAEDAIREMMAELSSRAVDLNQREQLIEDRERLFEDRQQAFLGAAHGMKEFANRIYGPDSELSKINQKLGGIEAAGIARDKRYADRFQDIDDNQTRLKDWAVENFNKVDDRFAKIEHRVANLEKAG